MNRNNTGERPIAKPDFPLPRVFNPSKMSTADTLRSRKAVNERARFFVKQVDENGRPTYGFVITPEPADQESAN